MGASKEYRARTFIDTLEQLRHEQHGGHDYIDRQGSTHLGFPELVGSAEDCARALLDAELSRDSRVFLAISDPQEFVRVFLGCVRAGVVAVPISPPLSMGRIDAYLDVIRHASRTTGASVVIGDASIVRLISRRPDALPPAFRFLPCHELSGGQASLPSPTSTTPDDLVFLQLTSGSTDASKAVRVTHRSLIANTHAVWESLGATRDDKFVSWLPLYHDMGLVGQVLTPMYSHTSSVLMPTTRFIAEPVSWFEALSQFKGTITFAPNFAYAQCVRRISDLVPRDGETPNLDHVRVFGCGAEPIHPEVLEQFAAQFAPIGVRPESLLPCYGMAEATLAITFSDLRAPVKIDGVDPDRIRSEGVAQTDDSGRLRFVSCGRTHPRHTIEIIDETGNVLPDRRVGEIRVRGPSLADGYEGNPQATASSFTIDGLRTGDLGYLVEGELFVTGRLKDIIILQGRNYEPQTIEHYAQVPGVRLGGVAAFSRPGPDGEDVVVVAETRSPSPELEHAIRRSVQSNVGVRMAELVLVVAATLPKTSSGKIRRRLVRSQYLDGTLRRHASTASSETGRIA